MADLKAMLAAKKAAQQGKEVQTISSKDVDHGNILSQIVKEQKQEVAATPVNPPVAAPEKTLTFAEKMALKKAGQSGEKPTVTAGPIPQAGETSPNAVAPTQSSQTVAAQESTGNVTASASTAPQTAPTEATGVKPIILDEDKLRTGMLDPTLDAHPVLADQLAAHDATVTARELKMEDAILTDSVDPIIAQAYADISAKINLLESLEDTALEGAMKELKKALMANPNAVSLMLDTDYYKMVMALRKITREAAIEAAAEKKPGRTKAVKTAILSAEQIASVFEEL